MNNGYKIYSMRDRLADNFRNVFLDVSDAVARRNFTYAVNNSPELAFQSKDLELVCLGEFNDHTGAILCYPAYTIVCRGDEVMTDGK